MVNINPNRESCMEYMKELIRQGLPRNEVVEECKLAFNGVHGSTFYDWYDIVIKEKDIEEWEKENKREIMSFYNHKKKAKYDIYYWTYNRLQKQLNKFEELEKEDSVLLKDIYDLQDRLQNNYLKKME
tara:strand:+ start:764 stop:1147 length:384 start_codon:yes stop_codon:yes gene_type:complete